MISHGVLMIAEYHKVLTRTTTCFHGKEPFMSRILFLLMFLLQIACTATSFADNSSKASHQTIINIEQKPREKATLVVIYTMSTCPHCSEAKEYLTSREIPFINREVDTDAQNMTNLMSIYDSMGVPEKKRGVPLFVIGDRIQIQGFNKDKLQSAIKEVTSNQR